MAATKNLMSYETQGQITCTLTSLANGSARESNVVDNTTNKYLDDLISVTFTIASGSPTTAGPVVNVYAAGFDGLAYPQIQLSGGGTYPTGGGDSSVGALATPSNLRLVGSFGLQTTTSAAERTFRTEPMSVAQAFGGVLPSKYSIIVDNELGVALSTSTATTAQYLSHQPLDTTSNN